MVIKNMHHPNKWHASAEQCSGSAKKSRDEKKSETAAKAPESTAQRGSEHNAPESDPQGFQMNQL
jgi:hypothetical protein